MSANDEIRNAFIEKNKRIAELEEGNRVLGLSKNMYSQEVDERNKRIAELEESLRIRSTGVARLEKKLVDMEKVHEFIEWIGYSNEYEEYLTEGEES